MGFVEKGGQILSDEGFHLELHGVNHVFYCERNRKVKAFYESTINPLVIRLDSTSISMWEGSDEIIPIEDRKRILANIRRAMESVGAEVELLM